jgi:uncharacterized membrane-anchored protein YitT (DUF2179 family)
VYAIIRNQTNHGVTTFHGFGNYEKADRTMLYSVVSANEVAPLVKAIKNIDGNAFINVLKTEQLNGRFYMQPKD